MDDEYVPDEPDKDRTDVPGWRRSAGWFAGGFALLAVLGVGTVMVVNRPAAPTPQAAPSLSASASPRSASASPQSASASPRLDPLVALLTAVPVALSRVVPGADIKSDTGGIAGTTHPGPLYVAFGQVHARGRHGGLRIRVSRADGPLTCTGRGARCHMSTSSDGALLMVESFDEALPTGPRGMEIRATVARPDNWWVEVNIDNADAVPMIDLPMQYVSTGQAPPVDRGRRRRDRR
jgi:hypothetical protein